MNNRLTRLPESLGGLASLRELDLTNNGLESLPDSIGGLDRLARLSLRNNRVTSLPDDLGVYPTHGAGSFCSAPGGGERTTTIGAERRHNRLPVVEHGRLVGVVTRVDVLDALTSDDGE